MATESPIATARTRQRTLLTEIESKGLVESAGITATRTVLASTRDEAARIAADVGFPVVLKVVSPDVIHKSDAGGVLLDLADEAAVVDAYDRIVSAVRAQEPDATIEGVSVQPMVRGGLEVIVGGLNDPQFGPVVAFGLGGIWVEVLKDVTFRVLPITPTDAAEMVREIQGYPLLAGVRGQPAADLASIERVILGVASLMEAHADIESLDLNPVLVGPDGAIAVDARVLLSPTT